MKSRKNIVFEITQNISSSSTKEEILQQLNDYLHDIPYVYSYLIYANYQDNKLISWTIKYCINDIIKYNTLSNTIISAEIYDTLTSDKKATKRILGYKQPSFEIMLVLYTPLIRNLSKQICFEWPQIEYDDAVSICQLTMLKLYKKGYYLHKYLLEKSFKNAILMSLRKQKYAPEIVSLDDIVYNSDDDKQISLADTIADTQLELMKEEEEHLEQVQYVFSKMKEFIIDLIGERQFLQLYRDYSNKNTTEWSRKTMQKIKHELQKLRIDKNTLGGF